MKKILFTIMTAVVLAVATSCNHKELCYDHSHTVDVQVIFDWQYSPDAHPQSMAVYMFPQNGGEVLRYDITEHNGGTIRIPIGSYDVLCINSDTENIRYVNTDNEVTFQVATPTTSLLPGLSSLSVLSDGAPRATGAEDERVALAPDMLWSDYKGGIELSQTTINPTIALSPKQSVSTYTVEIRNATNLKYVLGLSGSVSSLAGGLFPCNMELSEELVTIPFEVTIASDNTTVTGGLLTFGDNTFYSKMHKLVIYAVLADNSKWYYTYDVTEQIHSAPDRRNIHIVLDGLPLPEPIENGSGFQPEVDDWQSVDVGIIM